MLFFPKVSNILHKLRLEVGRIRSNLSDWWGSVKRISLVSIPLKILTGNAIPSEKIDKKNIKENLAVVEGTVEMTDNLQLVETELALAQEKTKEQHEKYNILLKQMEIDLSPKFVAENTERQKAIMVLMRKVEEKYARNLNNKQDLKQVKNDLSALLEKSNAIVVNLMKRDRNAQEKIGALKSKLQDIQDKKEKLEREHARLSKKIHYSFMNQATNEAEEQRLSSLTRAAIEEELSKEKNRLAELKEKMKMERTTGGDRDRVSSLRESIMNVIEKITIKEKFLRGFFVVDARKIRSEKEVEYKAEIEKLDQEMIRIHSLLNL